MILGLRLRLKKSGRLVYSISGPSRAAFGVLFALLTYVLLSGVLLNGERTIFLRENWLAGLLDAIALFALLYEEKWIFDKANDSLEGRFGLVFAYRIRRIPLSSLREVRLEGFVRGRQGQPSPGERREIGGSLSAKTMVRLVAVDSRGVSYVLENSSGRKVEDLRRACKRIADYCGIAFRECGLV